MRNYENIEYFVNRFKEGSYSYENGVVINTRTGNVVKGTKRGKGGYLSFDSETVGRRRVRAHFHLVIYAYFHGMDELRKYETIDHVNGDKHDNRIENLEGCSVLENNKRWYDRYYGITPI